jgi:hypothetical protein
MKLFGGKEKKHTATQVKPSAPQDNNNLPPPQNPSFVPYKTKFKGRLECSIYHDLGRIDIIVSHEREKNKKDLLNDFLERVLYQVYFLKNNNVKATIKAIDIFLNVEFNLSKSIREKLSKLNVETYGGIILNLLLNGEDIDAMSSLTKNRITEIVADIEDADVFKARPITREKFDAICAENEIKITSGGNLWTSGFNPDKSNQNSNHKLAPKRLIKRKNNLTKTT